MFEKAVNLQIQDVQQTLTRIDTRKITLRHIMVRLPKTKDEERIWTTARKKYVIIMYRKTMMQKTTDFS